MQCDEKAQVSVLLRMPASLWLSACAAEGYAEYDSFPTLSSPPSWDLFYPRAGWLIVRCGMSTLKQTPAGATLRIVTLQKLSRQVWPGWWVRDYA